ncbi:MAG: type II toxin-antitoxin system HicB family antitoxin [Syntrophobacteraceae bacterium]
MRLEYPFTMESQEPSGFLVQFLDFEEAFTQEETVDECYFNAQEVLSLVIEQRLADGREVPMPSKSDSPHRTPPDVLIHAVDFPGAFI